MYIIPKASAALLRATRQAMMGAYGEAIRHMSHLEAALIADAITSHMRRVREAHFSAERDAPMERLTIGEIKRAVAKKTGISCAEMAGPYRTRRVADARHLAMFLARKFAGATYKAIALEFGGRGRTTIRHACRKSALLWPSPRAALQHIGVTGP